MLWSGKRMLRFFNFLQDFQQNLQYFSKVYTQVSLDNMEKTSILHHYTIDTSVEKKVTFNLCFNCVYLSPPLWYISSYLCKESRSGRETLLSGETHWVIFLTLFLFYIYTHYDQSSIITFTFIYRKVVRQKLV